MCHSTAFLLQIQQLRITKILKGNIDDKNSLKAAFKGAHSVFAVTNYWEKMDDKLEVQQGKNVADAAKAIFSY